MSSTPTNQQPTQAISDSGSPAASGLLSSHRVLQFAGSDAANFLQGYLTCDTAKLAEQQAQPGAFTNLKGRVVANGWVWGNATDVRMLVSATLTDTIADFLKMYLNFAKTTLNIAPFAPQISLTEAILSPAETIGVHIRAGRIVHNSGLTAAPASDPPEQPDLSGLWLDRAISQREVLITTPTSATLLPQMLGLIDIGTVSFDKGCYLGQEVVARAEHLGAVKRRLRRIEFTSDRALPAGASLNDQSGKRVAVVINATATATNTPSSHRALIVCAIEELEGVLWDYAGSPVQLAGVALG